MRRTVLHRMLLATLALTLLGASGLALVAGVGSATAESSVVGPGESIQKAIYAADPGDTIVVKGVHREDVVIRKNGIKLRGEDAVIEPPAKADSPCSRAFGPEAICVLGDVNFKHYLETNEVKKRVKDVSVSGFTIRGFKEGGRGGEIPFSIDVLAARNATVVGNRTTGNVTGGIIVGGSVHTTVAKNDVIGNPETDAEGILVEGDSRNTTVVKNAVSGIPEDHNAIEVHEVSDTTIEGNHLIDNFLSMVVVESPGTRIVSNDMTDSTLVGTLILDSTGTEIVSNDISRSGDTGIAIFGPERANNDAKVVGNRISGGPWGIYVERAHGGSFTGNQVHDNCAGMFFEAFKAEPVGGFEVKGNTVTHNTRSCRSAKFDINFSGIGIALLGASNMEVTANHLSGNVPSGPTPVSGGVVVSKDPYYRGTKFGGTQKPTNNTVTANHFGRNNPDIFWDKSGTGNVFRANYCDTSVPTSLCK